MIPGYNVVTGFSKDEEILVSRLQSLFGSSIVSLALEMPKNVIDGYVTGLTSFIGPTYSYSPNSVGPYNAGLINGRTATYCDDPVNKQRTIRATTGTTVTKSFWRVSKIATSGLQLDAVNLLCNSEINSALVFNQPPGDTWFANSWTHYVNGVESESISVGNIALYEASRTATTGTGVGVNGYYGDYTPRSANPHLSAFVLALSDIPTSTQRQLSTQYIKSYYRIV